MKLFIKFLYLFLFPSILFSQSKEDLLIKKQKLQEEINYTNSLLKEINSNKKSSVLIVQTLDKKIINRELMIKSISVEIDKINDIIVLKTLQLSLLDSELDTLKNDFARIIKKLLELIN